MRTGNIIWRLVPILLFSLSCKEELPVHNDPDQILQAITWGQYVISPTDNSLKGYLTVSNVFDEALDGQAYLRGTLRIVWDRNSEYRKTFSITPANVISAPQYNRTTGRLTILPGDSIRLGVSWDFVADDGRRIEDWMSYHRDPTCSQRLITVPLTFTISAELKVFDVVGFVVARSSKATFQHHRSYVSNRFCTP